MYSWIKFDNQECLITLSKKVKIVQGKICLIKIKGSLYQGYLLNTDGKLIVITSKYNLLISFIEHIVWTDKYFF